MSQPAALAAASPARDRAVLGPIADVLLVGGLSLLACAAVLLSGRLGAEDSLFARFAFLDALVNGPHFIASYALLYGAPTLLRRHPGVAWLAPAVLLAWAVAAVLLFSREPALLRLLYVASAVLLAWHYTGQAFGMMASFSFVDGLFFDPLERRLVRANLFALLAWHVIWAFGVEARTAGAEPAAAIVLGQALRLFTPVAAGSALLGAFALLRLRHRTGRTPGLRVVLPWLAVHAWYGLILLDDRAIFLAQLSHALQYLAFPLRVQLNRAEAVAPGGSERRRIGVHLSWLLLASLTVFFGVTWLLQRGPAMVGYEGPPLALAFIAIVNIHHYLVDGVVWKLSNPEVRKDLFAHLPRS